jgi:hypothetical protein
MCHSKRLATRTALLFGVVFGFFPAHRHCAAYKDDIGYNTFTAELGGAPPNAAGVPVLMAESQFPQTHAEFVGKTIVDRGAGPQGSHATEVGWNFFGLTTSVASGVTQIEVYDHSYFVTSGFMRWMSQSMDPSVSVQHSRVANHSWVGSAGTSNLTIDHLGRIDWLVSTDDFIQVAGVDNSSNQNTLYSNALNAIPVGRTDGIHAQNTLQLNCFTRNGTK